MTRIGITGARGVLGRLIAAQARVRGHTADAFPGDIRDAQALDQWLTTPFDAVLHLAARVPVARVQADPDSAMAINAGGTRTLLQAIARSGRAPWVFYASTSHVYAPSDAPLAEDAPCAPVSTYGTTKLAGEAACTPFADRLPLCIGRIFSYWHDTQAPEFLYPAIRHRLATEDLSRPFALRGADAVRDFLPAQDVADLILCLMDRRATGIFNIASGQPVTIRDFVRSLAPRPLDIVAQGGGNRLVADITKLNRELAR